MFGTAAQRFYYFSQLLADFLSLPIQDQDILLRDGVLEMCILRLALVYHPINNCWPNKNSPLNQDSPALHQSDMEQLATSHLHRMNANFINWVKQVDIDEPTVMLLIMVVLFTPERNGIIWKEGVEKCQLHYTSLMQRYMKWRYGPDGYKLLFGKLLTKLSDLRELGESHNFLFGMLNILGIFKRSALTKC